MNLPWGITTYAGRRKTCQSWHVPFGERSSGSFVRPGVWDRFHMSGATALENEKRSTENTNNTLGTNDRIGTTAETRRHVAGSSTTVSHLYKM